MSVKTPMVLSHTATALDISPDSVGEGMVIEVSQQGPAASSLITSVIAAGCNGSIYMPLTGKSSNVSAAAYGIGLTIASEAALAGAPVVLAGQNVGPLEAVVSHLRSGRLDVSACAVSIATAAGNRQLVKHTLALKGRVDCFRANAGIAPFADLLQANAEQTLYAIRHSSLWGEQGGRPYCAVHWRPGKVRKGFAATSITT